METSQPGYNDLPEGTVTFLFTDIEGSTQLLSQLRDQYATLLADQRRILREAFINWHGQEVDTQGDAFFVSFPRATGAVSAVVEIQRALAQHQWPEGVKVRVRMGLHTGEPIVARTGYIGMDVHRAVRIAHVGHGGQVLLSETTAALMRDKLPEGIGLRDLGEHHLKDLQRPEHLHQLVIPDLRYKFPPLKSLDTHPNNLPVQLTSFVGREVEMAQVKQLIEQERLLTLTGPGGSGKTRLALQVAAELTEDFPEGIFLVRLTPIKNHSLVIPTIAQTLGLHDQGKGTMMETLTEWLANKQILLLLNNFEHVIPAAPELTKVLAASLQVKMLVTSREALHLRGEQEYPIQPLTLPDLEHLPPVEVLSAVPAVELFTQRARAVQTSFVLTDNNASTVSEICSRLDGLPLAIELAAARIKLLPPDALLKRLVQANGRASLRLLAGGPRDAPERHRTLRATIEWSYDLLDSAEQWLFRNLSLFVGGFTLPAAEVVCCAQVNHITTVPLETPLGDVVEGVASLLNKSLLRHELAEDSEPRFNILEMVRSYALEKLVESGQEERSRERHANYFLELAETASHMLQGPQQKTWFEQLEREHNNLRTALEWFLQQAEGKTLLHTKAEESGLRMTAALWRFWDTHGYVSEGRRWLERALAAGDAQINERVDALNGTAYLAMRQADVDEAIKIYDESLALARQLGYERGIAVALNGLWYMHEILGDIDLMESLVAESLDIWRELGDKHGIAQTLGPLAHCAASRYDFKQSKRLYQESLALFQEVGDQREIAGALWNLGDLASRVGDCIQAKDLFKESLVNYRELKDIHGIATQLRSLGEVARCQGNTERALVYLEEGLSTFREIEDKTCTSHTLLSMARVALDQGKLRQASSIAQESLEMCQQFGYTLVQSRIHTLLGLCDLAQDDACSAMDHFRESLSLLQKLDDFEGIPANLDGIARLAISEGEYTRAARLFAASSALRTRLGITLHLVDLTDVELLLATTREGLGEISYQTAISAGSQLTLEEALDLALESDAQDSKNG